MPINPLARYKTYVLGAGFSRAISGNIAHTTFSWLLARYGPTVTLQHHARRGDHRLRTAAAACCTPLNPRSRRRPSSRQVDELLDERLAHRRAGKDAAVET
jgi:hypothetical protein